MMKEDDVLDYMNQLESDDESLNEFSKKYEMLASFLAEYDFLKDKRHLSQKDVAEKMGTTQSAISRIERLKTNPSYFQLKKMAEAVGGELFLSPMGEYSITLPVDLQEVVESIANKKKETVKEYLEDCIHSAVKSDYEKLKVELEKECFYSEPYNQKVQNYSNEIKDIAYSEYDSSELAA